MFQKTGLFIIASSLFQPILCMKIQKLLNPETEPQETVQHVERSPITLPTPPQKKLRTFQVIRPTKQKKGKELIFIEHQITPE